MRYWVFQNNQVIGPYGPDDLGRLVAFTPESLVCPEGRKGTSMGDWQRAGMVPDLSVALVKSSQRQPARVGLATLAGLPPEPTLKDLAVLGGLQEKVAMLEDVAAQLQESLRQKEAELSSVHGALADKDRAASELKRGSDELKRESEELKRQLAAVEERLGGVGALSETLDKAVETERQVQGDVLKQGETIAALARELEELRRRLDERPAAPERERPLDIGLPVPAPQAAPAVELDLPAIAPAPVPAAQPVPAPGPAFADSPLPPAPAAPEPAGLRVPDLMMSAEPFAIPADAGAPEAGGILPTPAPGDAPSAPADLTAAPEAKPRKSKALLVGAALGVLALGAGVFFLGMIPGMGPAAPESVVEAPVAPPPEPLPPPPPPPPDPRQEAVALAKLWPLPGGRTLGAKLDSEAPASGSLSPWMAEALPDGRVQVNYFASGAAAGSPTIAYEFVVDLAGKSLSGRNAAAKAMLSGKTAVPPKRAAPRPVRVKPKKPAPKPAADDEGLDALLAGDEPAPEPAGAPAPKPASGPAAQQAAARDEELESLLLPGYGKGGAGKAGEAPAADEGPAPRPAKARAERPARGGAKPAAKKTSDEALLDDLLQE